MVILQKFVFSCLEYVANQVQHIQRAIMWYSGVSYYCAAVSVVVLLFCVAVCLCVCECVYDSPELIPHTKRPIMNMAGWTANDCSSTASEIIRLLSSIVYFLEIRKLCMTFI